MMKPDLTVFTGRHVVHQQPPDGWRHIDSILTRPGLLLVIFQHIESGAFFGCEAMSDAPYAGWLARTTDGKLTENLAATADMRPARATDWYQYNPNHLAPERSTR